MTTARVLHGDCREILAGMEEASVDAVVCDPPYGLSFMGKDWDHGVPGVEFWRATLRVLKPGGHLVAFGGTRTFHRLTCAIEDAGFEVRDVLSWMYGSGFPKSLDVSKAIDRRHVKDGDEFAFRWKPIHSDDVYRVTAFVKAARDRSGKTNKEIDNLFGFCGMAGHWTSSTSQPAVPSWPQWVSLKELLGFGDEMDALVEQINGGKGDRSIENTALGAREVIGTRRGTDTSVQRIAAACAAQGLEKSVSRDFDVTTPKTATAQEWEGWGTALKPAWEPIVLARKPLVGSVAANVLSHGTGALNVDGCRVGMRDSNESGWSKSGSRESENRAMSGKNYDRAPKDEKGTGRWPANVVLDEEAAAQLGEQSRFFYCAKASRAERGEGNDHPTVKPVALMRWLCRLVTPPGGLVLDPFCGSGSTGIAARSEDFHFVGVDLDEHYCEIARRRIGCES
jgi:DNA modification methylase